MVWDERLAEYLALPWQERQAFLSSIVASLRTRLVASTDADLAWMRATLRNEEAKWFVTDVLRITGFVLVSIIVSGSLAEQQGAASALYWTWGSPFSSSHLFVLFTTFLTTTDLILRQELLSHLPLGPKCPETLQPLAEVVDQICRASSDDYLRSRAAVQRT